MPRIDRSGDDRGEQDAAALLETAEGVAPGRIMRRQARAGDGDQSTPLGQAGQSRRHVTQGGVGDTSLDMGPSREGRVHQDDGGDHRSVEVVVDVGGVEPADRGGRKQATEQFGAPVAQLVERQFGAREFGEDGEQPGAGRRFEHKVAGSEPRGARGDPGERDRRRELLKRLAFLRSPRLAGQEPCDLADHGQLSG
ncbi:hypothetical protein [Phenylobacterium sp.]|uniref:hypothetical protein n=1 Tax=Phenylobacterium sp. TaxID=1871053 RepID=UPI00260D15E9|nr:hypothetical protein [Phenylobacterium sp.]